MSEITGHNTLILNTATMIKAMQFWLDSRMLSPVPTVVGVDKPVTNSIVAEFRIELSDKELVT